MKVLEFIGSYDRLTDLERAEAIKSFALSFDPEKVSQDIHAEILQAVRFPNALSNEIREELKAALFKQKMRILSGKIPPYWDNQGVYETQLKLCAEGEIMPKIWGLAQKNGKIEEVLNGLARAKNHKKESPFSTTKQMREDAKELGEHLKKIEAILRRNRNLKSSFSCDLRDSFKKHAQSSIQNFSKKLIITPLPLEVAIKNGDPEEIAAAVATATIERITKIPPDSLEMIRDLQGKLKIYEMDEYEKGMRESDRYIRSHYYASQGTQSKDAPDENMLARKVCRVLRPLYSKNAVTDFLRVLCVLDNRFLGKESGWNTARLSKLL